VTRVASVNLPPAAAVKELPPVPFHRPSVRLPRALRAGRLRSHTVRLVVGLAATAAVLTGPAHLGGSPPETGSLRTAATTFPEPTDAPTQVRVSSFNLLGYGHTQPGGGHPKYTDGLTRMNWAVQIIANNDLQVIGFQEMQAPQYTRFKELTGSDYGVYPGNKMTTAAMANSIAWRKSEWQLVDAETVPIPYFHGNLIRMPYVLLQNVQTGRQTWFFNSHNPADAHGDAQRWRNKAVAIEAALFNQLRTDYPTTPLISTGDENDRDKYFCPMVKATSMRASNGGGLLDSTCVMPDAPTHVDWVMGSDPLVQFTRSVALHSKLVRKTTDHFVIVADAVLPSEPVMETGPTRAVVVSVDGLTSRELRKAVNRGEAPKLGRMISSGASTLNARTAAESTGRLANLAGLLTGRPVDPTKGGTGIGWHGSSSRGPLTTTAGHYVSSVFDVVHDYGKSTAFYTSRYDADLLASSWNAANGASDPFGLDNGRNKIGRYVRTTRDDDAVASLVSALASKPATLSVVQLDGLHAVGKRSGFRSAEYAAALAATDRLIGRIQTAIADNPRLSGRTMLVVTANRGGSGSDAKPTTVPGVYRVPLLVTGPGVLPGGDLYAMNPAYPNPRDTNPDYASGRPIRNALVADLVTKMLGLPPVPGSRLGARQDLTVLAPPVS
jgi:Type I phosphodiesterase / nucleotide pyrophosphatase